MKHTINEFKKINKFFFTKIFAQKILKLNYEILTMNCTYKINTYRMFLYIINKITFINITFYVNFYFLFKKLTKNYI